MSEEMKGAEAAEPLPGKLYQIAKPIPKGRSRFSVIADPKPGVLGGNRACKIYGRLDSPSALRYVEKGTYQKSRVFFHSVKDAIACGFRPCARCLPEEYARWKATQS